MKKNKQIFKKFNLLGWLLLISLIAMGAKIGDNDLKIGVKTGSDITIKMGEGRLIWNSATDKMQFSNDSGASSDDLGTGGGGGDTGINNLDNPGFESGITADWSCTATKCTEETTNPLAGGTSLIFTPTAQNNEFVSTLKAITPGLMGRACEARVFYLGGDDNLTAQIVNGDSEVLVEKVLVAHSISAHESLFFLCPTQATITGDSDKGDLQLRVFNETVTAAAVTTFDNMRLGDLVGLTETTLPDVFSARMSSTGTIISENVDFINGNCTNPATGQWACTFNSGIFTVIPKVTATISHTGITSVLTSINSITTNGFNLYATDHAGVAIDRAIEIAVAKQGVDAKQSVQIYTSIPTVADNTNQFTAKVATNGTVSDEDIEFINGNCTNVHPSVCTFVTNTFSTIANCRVTTRTAQNFCSISTANVGSITLACYNDVGDATTTSVAKDVVCNKTGVDFKLPIVQPIVIPNAVFYPEHVLTVAGTNWTTGEAVATPYTVNGQWFVNIRITGTLSTEVAILLITITDLVFATGANQSGGGYAVDAGVTLRTLKEVNFNNDNNTMDLVTDAVADLYVVYGIALRLKQIPGWL